MPTDKPSLDDLLDMWSVMPPEHLDQPQSVVGWYAVTNDNGIIAYFAKEEDAFRFRLAEINRVLNG